MFLSESRQETPGWMALGKTRQGISSRQRSENWHEHCLIAPLSQDKSLLYRYS